MRVYRELINFSALFLSASALFAQADWPSYGKDETNQRHSTLKQITAGNVSGLTRAWTFHMAVTAPAGPAAQQGEVPPAGAPARGVAPAAGRGGGGRGRSSEASPIVVNGVLYMPTPYNRVVALEPETGKEIWTFEIPGNANASTRGVEYWPGDGASPASIFFGTISRLGEVGDATVPGTPIK